MFLHLKASPTRKQSFQDNPNRQPNFVLSSAMDTQSETEVSILENNSYGTSLVFLNENEEWIYKSNDSLQPSFKHFLFQKKLQEEFFGKLKLKRSVRKQRRTRQEIDEKIELKPVDPVVLDLIYVHSVKKGFTNSSVEDYLSLMDDITQTSFERTVNKTHWKTTKKNYDKFVNVFSPLKRPEYVLPPEMYGSDANGDPLRPYYGVSVDILEEISFSLLNVDNVQENFAFRYEEMKNCTGNRITGPFHTAERFKRLDKYVKKGMVKMQFLCALFCTLTQRNLTQSCHDSHILFTCIYSTYLVISARRFLLVIFPMEYTTLMFWTTF